MDKITETIAHFAGHFEITLEQARLKQVYEEFRILRELEEAARQLDSINVKITAGFDFAGFDPGLKHVPLPPELVRLVTPSEVVHVPPEVEIVHPDIAYPGFTRPDATGTGGSQQVVLPDVPPPGSVAVYISQHIRLSDADYASVGGHGLAFTPTINTGAGLAALVDRAEALSPLSDQKVPGSTEEVASFIAAARAELNRFEGSADDQATEFIARGEAAQGTHVNGVLVEEAPNIQDHVPDLADTEEPEEEVPQDIYAPGGEYVLEASVGLQAGSNLLVNSAVITNNWTSGTVVAAMGDLVELNAIVQAHALGNTDLVSNAMAGWSSDVAEPDDMFNVASLERIDPSADSGASQADGFPQYWVVTRFDGDLTVINWIKQYTFMVDDDAAVMSSSGATTLLTTGDNTATNSALLLEFSYHYDLIFVGGNIYDANLVRQATVLLDNDLIGAAEGFETTGPGSVSTQGNLLWNEASIVNVGATENYAPLPGAYRQAGSDLAAGKDDIPNGVLSDGAFAGVGLLKVLYVTGHMANLNYVDQAVVLGDSDQVALAMDQVNAHPEADWTISTGNNALANRASILDVDFGAAAYFGGQQYSDEILIQAELITVDAGLGGMDPDVLVNEAVAFLDDDMLAPANAGQPASHTMVPVDGQPADVMQTMLA